MAQKFFTLAFIIGTLVLSQAVFLENKLGSHFAIFSQLKQIEDSSFGKQVLDTIALQIKNNAPLAEVSKLLQDLKGNLMVQQNDLEKQNQADTQDCETTIAEFDGRITAATEEIRQATLAITRLEETISELDSAIENKKKQLEILKVQEDNAVEAHKKDLVITEKRTLEHKQVQEALELILPQLKALVGQVAAEAPVALDYVLAQLTKIGGSNPIASMIQLATSMDQGALEKVISQLEELQTAINESLKDDLSDAEESTTAYNSLISEIKTVRQQLVAALQQDNNDKREAEANLETQKKRLSDNQAELKEASEGKKAKVEECAKKKALYEKNKKQMADEYDTIDLVIGIVATKLDTMSDFLKDRANNGV